MVQVKARTGQAFSSEELPDHAHIRSQLERILADPLFQHSKRYPAFLRYIVEETLRGAGADLKERSLGMAVFKRVPEYDTSADPVVRITASDVRKRLEQYYSEPGRKSEPRIVLPVGTYVPEFRFATPVEPAATAGSPAAGTRRLPAWLLWAAAISALAFVVFAAISLVSRKPAIDLFWAPILQTSEPVLVVTGTWTVPPRPVEAAEIAARQSVSSKMQIAFVEQSAKLASFLQARGKQPEFQLDRNVDVAVLRKRPFILEGAFNNAWTLRAVAPFRFYLQRDDLRNRIVDRDHPERSDWVSSPDGISMSEDYALVVRAPEPETGQMMLVAAGLSGQGTAAAWEFITNPKYIEQFASQAPAGWEKRKIEIVIRTRLVNNDWGEPRIIATHLW
jgi:hypothetical protein